MVQKAMDDIEASPYLHSFEKLHHRLYQNMTLTIVQIMSKGQQKIRKLHPKNAPYNQNGGERQCWVDAGSVGLPPRWLLFLVHLMYELTKCIRILFSSHLSQKVVPSLRRVYHIGGHRISYLLGPISWRILRGEGHWCGTERCTRWSDFGCHFWLLFCTRRSLPEDGLESDVCQKVIDNLAGVVKFFGLELTEDTGFDRTKPNILSKDENPLRMLASCVPSPQSVRPLRPHIGLSKQPCCGSHLHLRAYNKIIGKHVGRTFSSRTTQLTFTKNASFRPPILQPPASFLYF